jgi:hypothetical protein
LTRLGTTSELLGCQEGSRLVSDVGTSNWLVIAQLSRECGGSGAFGAGPSHMSVGEVALTLVLMDADITLMM